MPCRFTTSDDSSTSVANHTHQSTRLQSTSPPTVHYRPSPSPPVGVGVGGQTTTMGGGLRRFKLLLLRVVNRLDKAGDYDYALTSQAARFMNIELRDGV